MTRKYVVIMSRYGKDVESVGPYHETFAMDVVIAANAIAQDRDTGVEARMQEVTSFLDGDTQ